MFHCMRFNSKGNQGELVHLSSVLLINVIVYQIYLIIPIK